MNGIEILKELIGMGGWPGAIAAVTFIVGRCYKEWLAAQRARVRLGDSEFEARNTRDVLCLLREAGHAAAAPGRTIESLPPESVPRRRSSYKP